MRQKETSFKRLGCVLLLEKRSWERYIFSPIDRQFFFPLDPSWSRVDNNTHIFAIASFNESICWADVSKQEESNISTDVLFSWLRQSSNLFRIPNLMSLGISNRFSHKSFPLTFSKTGCNSWRSFTSNHFKTVSVDHSTMTFFVGQRRSISDGFVAVKTVFRDRSVKISWNRSDAKIASKSRVKMKKMIMIQENPPAVQTRTLKSARYHSLLKSLFC